MFEITDCDLKRKPARRQALSAIRFYLAGHRHAFVRPSHQARHRSQHRHNADLRAPSPTLGDPRGCRSPVRATGMATSRTRRTRAIRFRNHPAIDRSATGSAETSHRISGIKHAFPRAGWLIPSILVQYANRPRGPLSPCFSLLPTTTMG
jgi:hypothetical protein